MVDLDLVNGGETSSPILRIMQEIDIIMSASKYQLIHASDTYINFDGFLFKSNLNTNAIASTVLSKINSGISHDNKPVIEVEAGYIGTVKLQEILLVNVSITMPQGQSEVMQYTISNDTN